MTRRLLLTVLFVASAAGQDAPQAVKALAHLKPRPNGGPTSWTNGPYQYDGAGNIKAIGGEAYVYDKVGRLKNATLRGPDLSSMQTQSFDFDEYGNLIAAFKLGQTVLLPVTAGTNRLNSAGYDASGNLTASGARHYVYDAVGMLNSVLLGSDLRPRIIYAYTADDERLFAYDVSTSTTHWTLRGFDNKVLRDFRQVGSVWSVDRDYVYRDGLLLAALKSSGAVEHYTLDHLGTPRLITDGAGHKIGYHVYWPFGEEWSPGTVQENSPLKFTGHERDGDPTGGPAPLDYMHARNYGAGWGRFLSVDPDQWYKKQNGTDEEKREFQVNLRRPQGWNRYSYAYNNPVRDTDPDGKVVLVDDAAIGLFILGSIAVVATETYLQTPNANDPGYTNAQVMGMQIKSAATGLIGTLTSLAQNNRHHQEVATSQLAAAAKELGKVSSAGGPGKDPDFNHHKGEIKAMLDRALRVAKRLPKKAYEEVLRQARAIGSEVGLKY